MLQYSSARALPNGNLQVSPFSEHVKFRHKVKRSPGFGMQEGTDPVER